MAIAVTDAECTGLLEHMLRDSKAQMHCAMFQEITIGDSGEFILGNRREFYDEGRVLPEDRNGWTYSGNLDGVLPYMRGLTTLCGHNIIEYDLPVFAHHLGELPELQLVDSLVISRKNWPDRDGGHSVDAWAKRIGMHKPAIEEWHTFTPEIRDRCREDVEIETQILWHVLEEHRVNLEKCA